MADREGRQINNERHECTQSSRICNDSQVFDAQDTRGGPDCPYLTDFGQNC
jgi:hypothetical protein